jgi:predicted HicB family RNase H-like nuclease
VAYDAADGPFSGIVASMPDTIHFTGRSIKEPREEFKNSVEVHLTHCRKIGKEFGAPEKRGTVPNAK